MLKKNLKSEFLTSTEEMIDDNRMLWISAILARNVSFLEV